LFVMKIVTWNLTVTPSSVPCIKTSAIV